MKKYVLTMIVALSVFTLYSSSPVRAQSGSMMGLGEGETETSVEGEHGESIEVVLQEILSQQEVSTVQELDLSQVNDDDWERLGDAVMEQQHPGQAHEMMDQMMGGEGSESLRQIHINMGKSYLGSGDATYGTGMMGFGMMGNGSWRNNRNQFQGGSMMGLGSMGIGGFMGAGTATMGLFGLVVPMLVVVFLILGIAYFWKQLKSK